VAVTPDELRALQAPLKTRYREDPSAKLLELTERYCVVYQTLVKSPPVTVTHRTA
jgi:uncharacterized OsmC-like protein